MHSKYKKYLELEMVLPSIAQDQPKLLPYPTVLHNSSPINSYVLASPGPKILVVEPRVWTRYRDPLGTVTYSERAPKEAIAERAQRFQNPASGCVAFGKNKSTFSLSGPTGLRMVDSTAPIHSNIMLDL